jgi:hypothetical protein
MPGRFHMPDEVLSEYTPAFISARAGAQFQFPDRLVTIVIDDCQSRPSVRVMPENLGEFTLELHEVFSQIQDRVGNEAVVRDG